MTSSPFAPPPKPGVPPRHRVLADIGKTMSALQDQIERFLDAPEEGDALLLSEADDEDIFDELGNRGIDFVAWDADGEIIAGEKRSRDLSDQDEIDGVPDLAEAIDRFRRRDTLEALIHLERAIPALDGLHDAVLNLKR